MTRWRALAHRWAFEALLLFVSILLGVLVLALGLHFRDFNQDAFPERARPVEERD